MSSTWLRCKCAKAWIFSCCKRRMLLCYCLHTNYNSEWSENQAFRNDTSNKRIANMSSNICISACKWTQILRQATTWRTHLRCHWATRIALLDPTPCDCSLSLVFICASAHFSRSLKERKVKTCNLSGDANQHPASETYLGASIKKSNSIFMHYN